MGSDSETEKSGKEKRKIVSLAPIAKPLAGKKLCKRTLKLVRKDVDCRDQVFETRGEGGGESIRCGNKGCYARLHPRAVNCRKKKCVHNNQI